jgi:3'-phosphoadenosine 5'-phosphosulfate sulfotransferase (PAPS reductase)/FAD synthetase
MSNINVLSVSGGKDSTAMWLWAIENEIEVGVVCFADTGHESPITYGYLDYLESKLGTIQRVKADFSKQIEHKREVVQTKWRKDGISESIIEQALEILHPTGNPFLDLCLWKGRFPSTMARFCTEELKIKPIENQIYAPIIERGDEITSYQAVRAQESPARAKLPDEEDVLGKYSLLAYRVKRPLLHWMVEEVFEIHKRHGIMPNQLYSQGMSRVGCMPCINANKNEIYAIATRFPEEIKRVAGWEEIVAKASKRAASSFYALSDRGGGNIEKAVEWSKTSRGGKQYDLFKTSEDTPMCSSLYGLCE